MDVKLMMMMMMGVGPDNKEVAGVKSLSHLASPDAKVHFQYTRTDVYNAKPIMSPWRQNLKFYRFIDGWQ